MYSIDKIIYLIIQNNTVRENIDRLSWIRSTNQFTYINVMQEFTLQYVAVFITCSEFQALHARELHFITTWRSNFQTNFRMLSARMHFYCENTHSTLHKTIGASVVWGGHMGDAQISLVLLFSVHWPASHSIAIHSLLSWIDITIYGPFDYMKSE